MRSYGWLRLASQTGIAHLRDAAIPLRSAKGRDDATATAPPVPFAKRGGRGGRSHAAGGARSRSERNVILSGRRLSATSSGRGYSFNEGVN